ncbi:MAG: STAS domain-containing protein [Thermodesulfobacteriota bacterium]
MGEIILHSDCLINRAGELHRLFLHLLAGADEQVEIDMSATGRCDVSFFQLLCSACRSYFHDHKRIVLTAPLPPALSEQFRKAGFHLACSTCGQTGCPLKGALSPDNS